MRTFASLDPGYSRPLFVRTGAERIINMTEPLTVEINVLNARTGSFRRPTNINSWLRDRLHKN